MDTRIVSTIGSALADPTRVRLLALADGRTAVGEAAERLGVTSGTVTHHLAILHRAGLVEITRRGRRKLARRVAGVGVRLARELG